jgi:hypothetical protein
MEGEKHAITNVVASSPSGQPISACILFRVDKLESFMLRYVLDTPCIRVIHCPMITLQGIYTNTKGEQYAAI